MKKIFPFLLISLVLFVTMKTVNHLSQEKVPKEKIGTVATDSLSAFETPKEIILSTKLSQPVLQRKSVSSLPRLRPSAIKAHCLYNCKLLPVSKNGLCFSPGDVSHPDSSRPIYDKHWKRDSLQYL